MSQHSLEAFLRKLQQDGDLQRELKARFGTPEDGVAAADLAAFAAGKGYAFDVEDISTELDDAALSAVAGGLNGGDFLLKISLIKFDSNFIKIDGLSWKW